MVVFRCYHKESIGFRYFCRPAHNRFVCVRRSLGAWRNRFLEERHVEIAQIEQLDSHIRTLCKLSHKPRADVLAEAILASRAEYYFDIEFIVHTSSQLYFVKYNP